VLEVAGGGGPPADRAGAGGVPDLGQVPELDPGIMTPGLVPVVAVLGGDGVEGDDQVRPVSGGAQLPGAVAAGRPGLAGGGEGEPGPARWCWSGPGAVAGGSGPGAAVPDGVPLELVTVTRSATSSA
jgi:hypothetical protein